MPAIDQVKLWSPGIHWGVVAETAQFRAEWVHSAARKLRQQTGVGGDQPVEGVVDVGPFLVGAVRARGDDLAPGVAGVGLGIERDQQPILVVDRGDPAAGGVIGEGGGDETSTPIWVQIWSGHAAHEGVLSMNSIKPIENLLIELTMASCLLFSNSEIIQFRYFFAFSLSPVK